MNKKKFSWNLSRILFMSPLNELFFFLSAVFRGNQFSSICGNVWAFTSRISLYNSRFTLKKCNVVKLFSYFPHISSHSLLSSVFYNADSLILAFLLAFFLTSSFIQFPQTAREKSVFIKKFSFVVLGVC